LNFDEPLLFHFGLESKAVRHITKLMLVNYNNKIIEKESKAGIFIGMFYFGAF
jgi:hypothetical protein